MNGFEFAFTLFGLVLGLALAEGLKGLSSALKAGHRVRIGWSTALLGILVSCDVVTFWMYGWAMREKIPMSWPALFGGFLVTATYYVAASLIFPDDPEEWTDLDGHFEKQYRKVLGGIFLCNVALFAATWTLVGGIDATSVRTIIIGLSFFPVCLLAIFVPNRKVTIAAMLWLILLYPLSAVWN